MLAGGRRAVAGAARGRRSPTSSRSGSSSRRERGRATAAGAASRPARIGRRPSTIASSVSSPGRSGAGWRSASRAGRSCAVPPTTSRRSGPTAAARSGGRCSSGCAAPIPTAGRELLATTFAEETWEDREAFVDVLTIDLSDADEPFLEAALDDARKPVRPRPPAGWRRCRARASPRGWPSAPRRCCASRTASSSSSSPARPTRRWSATASTRAGRRVDRLRVMLAATPLATWSHDLVALPVADDLARVVHEGWAHAAKAQRDAEWARALWPVLHDRELLAVLPRAEGEALAAAAEDPFAPRSSCAGPWGPELSRAVLDGRSRPASSAASTSPSPATSSIPRWLRRPNRSATSAAATSGICATSSPSGLPCCGSCHDRRDATPPAPRRAALRRRAGGARARRRPAAAAQLAALAVGGGHLRARRRRTARSRPSTSAGAGSSSSPSRRSPPTARCCCSACPAPPRRGCPSTSPRRSAATRTLIVQGTAGTPEEAIRYGWNYARLLAEGPSRDALVPEPGVAGDARRAARPRRGAHPDPVRRAGRADHDPVREDAADPGARRRGPGDRRAST